MRTEAPPDSPVRVVQSQLKNDPDALGALHCDFARIYMDIDAGARLVHVR